MADYLLRQIETLVRFLAKVAMQRPPDTLQIVDEEGRFSQAGFLRYRVNKQLAEGHINEAENLLFATIEDDPAPDYLPVALDFYTELFEMDETLLNARDFTREEIREGLEQIKGIYGNWQS